ncbi:hypothetical protein B4W74_12715 [Staphylococcus intermedius]|nr:hypothetical protein B5C04_11935 [Staphylococcus intermedius]PCF77688.1 hypothetical protein B4W74_12715 [Staphylococcus intermedius]PCF78008.1 hypothetical protein B4W70_12065 [Staphylococcus intermedius]
MYYGGAFETFQQLEEAIRNYMSFYNN